MTREQEIDKLKRIRAKNRQVLERCGLTVMVKTVKDSFYFQDENGNTKSGTVEIDEYYSELNGFTINKANSRWYWIVYGNMPMENAKRLFDNPCGKTDIRVAGHCGCPAPDEAPWFTWLTPEGKIVIPSTEGEEWAVLTKKYPDMEEKFKKYVVNDTPELIAKQFVTSYHIDSELGLYIFIQEVKKLELPNNK